MSLHLHQSAPLDEDSARRLTQRIRDAVENLWSLLLEAHDGQVWTALGYGSWGEYVTAEFEMSRRHSYRLLDQGIVVRELEAASGVTHGSQPLVSEREARDIKPVIDKVTEQVRRRVEAGADPADAVAETVREFRPGPKTADRQARESGKAVLGSDNQWHTGRDDPPPWYRTVIRFAEELTEQLPEPEQMVDLGVWSNDVTEAKTDHAATSARDWLDRFIAARERRTVR